LPLKNYNIKTMIDVPCGDANWIFDSRETDSLDLYIGLDIVKPVVEANTARLAHHSNKVFRHWDGVNCPLPKIGSIRQGGDGGHGSIMERAVDLVHARDVLQHLTLDQGIRFLCNVFQSGARVFVTTTFPGGGTKNKAIREGGYFQNDLTVEPYNMPSITCTQTHPMIEIDQTCVYDLTQPWVVDWIAEKKCDEMEVLVRRKTLVGRKGLVGRRIIASS
jgi:hypothetical protein